MNPTARPRPRLARRAALLLALAGCASPEAAFFTLAAVPGTPRPAAARSLEVRRVTLAGYLDRPGIVRGNAGYRLDIASNERWGEPLGDMIGRVLVENLTQRLPGGSVVAEGGALSTDTALIAEVDVQRFDAEAGRVLLLAQMAVRPRQGRLPGTARTLRIEVPIGGAGTAAQVAAMSAALGQLADAIAAAA
ncbi:PqiC family protein [Roseomonas sp. NAR14]|uniref:PqiC family protein n=1 Tax=Roseomonas acroporae TaxID=2937791 RepID=A0A9X2BVT8_9PROT|nr:PqiC family protein [Roseomonas acroporae]MCK8783090.1 PqiC family protein [Roseomonas acroporae]